MDAVEIAREIAGLEVEWRLLHQTLEELYDEWRYGDPEPVYKANIGRRISQSEARIEAIELRISKLKMLREQY